MSFTAEVNAYADLVSDRPARMHIGRVLHLLRDLELCARGNQLRGKPHATEPQRALITEYRDELLDALTPRQLTRSERELLMKYLHRIDAEPEEIAHVIDTANSSPRDRVTFLRLAQGQPDFVEGSVDE